MEVGVRQEILGKLSMNRPIMNVYILNHIIFKKLVTTYNLKHNMSIQYNFLKDFSQESMSDIDNNLQVRPQPNLTTIEVQSQ